MGKPKIKIWRNRVHEIIFEADTAAGKTFDLILIVCILLSVLVVMLDSVQFYHQKFGPAFLFAEWFFTVLFTIEYFFRIASVQRPLKYIFSFFGIVDLLAILPTYFSLLFPGIHYLLVIRTLRILRIFRILKLVKYLREARQLGAALKASSRKITVFIFTVLTLVVIFGSIMYVIEGESNGFTSVPKSIYWAIVTLTTVGYGDVSPQTGFGQTLASLIMILGYAIIAVPTGIVTVELSKAEEKNLSTQYCPHCSKDGHDEDAVYCKFCGNKL